MRQLRSIACGLLIAFSLARAGGSEVPITVCAAASLKEAFFEIGRSFEAASAGTKVAFNSGASGQLVQQVGQGAPCDVLATADEDSMDRAVRGGRVVPGTRVSFASNTLVLVVPAKGSSAIAGLADLQDPVVAHIAIGTPESVPAGAYAKEALELAGQWEALKPKLVYGENVRQVLDYVAQGEVQAAFVYATDARLMKEDVRVVVPVKTKRAILYPIAVILDGGNEPGGRRFVDAVRSESGRRVLARCGFGEP
jgi:molybdate transport system substrate-binding protein